MPERLWYGAVYILGAYAVVGLVAAVAGASDWTVLLVGMPFLWTGGLLLTAALVTKLIQIGVRAAQD
jgi:hypothetical protein